MVRSLATPKDRLYWPMNGWGTALCTLRSASVDLGGDQVDASKRAETMCNRARRFAQDKATQVSSGPQHGGALLNRGSVGIGLSAHVAYEKWRRHGLPTRWARATISA